MRLIPPRYAPPITEVSRMDEAFLMWARAALSKLIASDRLEWRYNGLGLLQAYISDTFSPECRVHVWHPDLAKPNIDANGATHNHRFDLQSHVLHGSILHTAMQLHEVLVGSHQTYPVVNARRAMAMTGTNDGLVMRDAGRVVPFVSHEYLIPAGYKYRFNRWAYHHSAVKDLCITVVTKYDQVDSPARILGGHEHPIHAFDDPMPRERWQPYLDRAVAALTEPITVTTIAGVA